MKQGETADYPLRIVSPVRTGPRPQLTLVLAGRNNLPHHVTVRVGPNAGSLRTLTDITFDYYDSYQLTAPLEWSDVGSEQLVVRLTVNGVGGRADNVSLSYARLTYAQSADAEGGNLTINLPANATGKSFITAKQPAPERPAIRHHRPECARTNCCQCCQAANRRSAQYRFSPPFATG